MSSRLEWAYLLAAGTTLLAVIVTGIWWSQRRRNHRLGTSSSSSVILRARTPAEELRAARLRRLAQANSMAAQSNPPNEQSGERDGADREIGVPTTTPAEELRVARLRMLTQTNSMAAQSNPPNEQSDERDGADREIGAPTTTQMSTPFGSTAELHTGPKEAEEDGTETSQNNESGRPDETPATHVPPTKKSKDQETNLTATVSPAREGTAAGLAAKVTAPSSNSVFTVKRGVQSKPLSGLILGTIDENGCPVSKPLKTLDEFFQWLPGSDGLCVPTVPLRPRTRQDAKKPRTIICHDMMGGYQVDRFVQGMQTVEDYHFYHWHLIDAFIYFSHNLVTIPPPSWTNAAHQHGVLSLGTFITEWQDGAKMCAQIFSSSMAVNLAVDRLVMLAEYYQLDGWLINIENPVAVSEAGT